LTEELRGLAQHIGITAIAEGYKLLKLKTMGKAIEKMDVGNYRIKIYTDTDPSDPRGNDNLGTMICFHKRYKLGDENHGFKSDDYNGWGELKEAILEQHPAGVILPLYLYDHSGITMNTTGFSCRWDSGQVGFIVAGSKAIKDNFMDTETTDEQLEHAKRILIAEVTEYDQFLTGDVYGYKIFRLTMEGKKAEEVDSCWGFYGLDECIEETIGLARGFTIADEMGE
jgi:hypothetical protein